MKQQNWGIIGGGIMGMTLAHLLARKGYVVTLFEAEGNLGGLAGAWNIDDFTWDKFYHVILLSDTYTRNLLKELNLDNKINWVETKTGFYTNGNLYSMSNTLEFLSFPPLKLIDKFRLGLTIFVASKLKNRERLEKIPVTDWLIKWSGTNTFNKIWLPLLRAKLGDNYKKTSAAFIWATIQRMYAARRSGLKKEMFGYVNGGYTTIIEAFQKKLIVEGVKIKTNHEATEIKHGDDHRHTIIFSNGRSETFDKVILTLPSDVSAGLCKDLKEEEITKLKETEYIGVICAAIVLKEPISPYYVTNITDTWVPFTGVIEMSALVDKKQFRGNNLIYLPKYLHQNDKLFDTSDVEIKNMFISSLKKMYPSFSDNDFKYIGIAKARRVFALPVLNYSSHLPDIITSIPGIFILNASLIINGTLNVNETIQLAETKLEELMDNANE